MAFTCKPLAGLLLLAAASAVGAQGNDPDRTELLPRVTVSGSAPNPLAEPAEIVEFDDAPLARTPASVTTISSRAMRESGARSLSTTIRGQPGISDAYNTTGFIETLQMRGFVLDNFLNYRRNGLPVSNYVPFGPEKDMQFLFGLAALQSGTSSPGGLVNFVTKRPAVASLREVNAELSERGTWSLGADLSERVGPLGYRFNVVTEERRPNARDAPGDRRFASGAVELKLPRDALFEFEVEWQRSRQISVPGFGLLDSDGDGIAETLPPPIDPRINLNNQSWSQPFESRHVVGTARYELPLGANWRVGLRGLAQRIHTDDRIAFPDGCSSGPNFVYPGLCGNYDVDIYDFRSNDERRTTRSTEAYAVGRFAMAGVGHRLRFGARATRYAERFPPLQAYNFVGTTNVFAPVELPADPSLTVLNAERDIALDEAFVSDALSFGERWKLWLGARYVHVENRSALTDGTQSVTFRDDIVTPWVGLGWIPWRGGFFYVSTGSGVEAEVVPNRPGDFANPGQALPVGRSRQIEGGFKQELGDDGALTLAVFQIRKPYSADEPQPSGPPLRVANGRIARHRGIEFAWLQPISRAFSVEMAATYLDAIVDESIDPALVGKRVTNVPKVAASLVATLRPSEAIDLRWTNRLGYTGTKAVTTDNSVMLPASWQWDTVLVWSPAVTKPRIQVRAGIDNVTDRRYWREAPTQPWGATYLFAAQPRTYRVGVSAQW